MSVVGSRLKLLSHQHIVGKLTSGRNFDEKSKMHMSLCAVYCHSEFPHGTPMLSESFNKDDNVI